VTAAVGVVHRKGQSNLALYFLSILLPTQYLIQTTSLLDVEMGEVYRNSVKIVGDVLRITDESGMTGVNLTALLRKANLSYSRLANVAVKLLDAGMIDEQVQEGQRIYVITSRGRDYLRRYQQFAEVADSFGLKL
jgi:predicted transcriptional regulator